MRFSTGSVFRQLTVLLLVAFMALASGYAAAASRTGSSLYPWKVTAALAPTSPAPADADTGVYAVWANAVLKKIIGLQGGLGLRVPLIWDAGRSEKMIIGQPLSEDWNQAAVITGTAGQGVNTDSGPIGPSATAPLQHPSSQEVIGLSAEIDEGPVETGDDVGRSWNPVTHIVRTGENLSAIAHQYGVDTATIIDVNALRNPDVLAIGQRLVIPPVNGRLYEVKNGDALWAISDRFDVDIGDIIDANAIDDPAVLFAGQVLFIPGATQSLVDIPAAVAASTGGTRLAWPLPSRGRISSPFGPRAGSYHTGLDIAVPLGTPILAAADGQVLVARWLGAYGRAVVVMHPGSSWKTLYAHASRLIVREGQWVRTGQTLGYVGSSGRSTGPHLHFEVIIGGQPRNPLRYVAGS